MPDPTKPPRQVTYREVKSDILDRITSGDWGPDSLLPNEVDIAAGYGCSRATVNRAMRELADDGLVERRRKAGTRVRKSPLRQVRFEIPVVGREIEASGAQYRYALARREVLAAPDWLRDRMGLGDKTRVLHLICMHYADDTPYQYEDRWINLAALPQARAVDFSATGPNEWLVATVPYSDAEISFSATSADAVLADHLHCAPGTALFRADRSTWFQGRALTRVALVFRPGHRLTTRY
jgi:GntR family histidine utilization transcriptional repressor